MTESATCWTLIEGAARGDAPARERFANHYGPVVRAYLAGRWGSTPMARELDDALQDVFLECLRDGGVLTRVERRREGGFRAFLYGVTRNVAARCESRRNPSRRLESVTPDGEIPGEADLERVFDRAWALSCVRQAVEVQRRRAAARGEAAARRVRLLEHRFQEGMPIREIAAAWGEDAARLHHEYATAREEFEDALREVVAFHGDGDGVDAELDALMRSIR